MESQFWRLDDSVESLEWISRGGTEECGGLSEKKISLDQNLVYLDLS